MNNGLLIIVLLGATTAAGANTSESYCYGIHVNSKDRSFFQYIDNSWARFADPSWKRNPQVREIRLVDADGKRVASPMVIQQIRTHSSPGEGFNFAIFSLGNFSVSKQIRAAFPSGDKNSQGLSVPT